MVVLLECRLYMTFSLWFFLGYNLQQTVVQSRQGRNCWQAGNWKPAGISAEPADFQYWTTVFRCAEVQYEISLICGKSIIFYRCISLPLCSRHMFLMKKSDRLLILQCDSGHQYGDLVACARHIIMNTYKQCESEEARPAGKTHVILVIQLPRIKGGCFSSFQVITPLQFCVPLKSLIQAW